MTDIAPAGGSRHVLVVEDDQDLAELLAAHLRRLGHRVQTVGTGEAALDAVGREVPEVVVCDIVLPGIDGRELVRRLRGDAGTSRCRIVVTSVLDLDGPDELGPLGADAVLPKPFTRRDVESVMTSLAVSA